MPGRLAGKKIIVTGGVNNIGKEAALNSSVKARAS